MYSGLHRSDRLLPLEEAEVLTATETFRLHVLDDAHDDKLREHVSFYWRQQHEQQRYQQQLLRQVRPTRGPVRFVGFPQVRQAHATGCEVASEGESRKDRQDGTEKPSGLRNKAALMSSSSPTLSEQTQPPTAGASALVPGESKMAPPRALAAWNWVRLVAPYEKLLCPSLLFSALLSPAVDTSTSLYHGSCPPSQAPFPLSEVRQQRRDGLRTMQVSAQWSVQTCRALWRLHESAAATSLPAQEVYIFCAGTMLYLDVVVAAGHVWAELESLWGRDVGRPAEVESPNVAVSGVHVTLKANEEHFAGEKEERDEPPSHAGSEERHATARTALQEWTAHRAALSQPPQTYASLLKHARVLLEALMHVAPPHPVNASRTPAAASARPDEAPQPFLPWLTAAMEREEWTSVKAAAHTSEKETHAKDPSGEAATGLRKTSAVAQTLRCAVGEWLSRRSATVTATAPTGSRAVPLPARDLYASTEPLSSSFPDVVVTAGTVGNTVAAASSSQNSAPNASRSLSATLSGGSTNTATAVTAPTFASRGTPVPSAHGVAAAKTNSGAAALAFEPFVPHDTPRAQHPFFLPPLPQDPALVAFAVVWRRTLRRCVAEQDEMRLHLRQLVLGQAGQRCEELLRDVREEQQPEGEDATMEKAPANTTFVPLSAAATAGHADHRETNTVTSDTVAPPVRLLLTSDPTATSFRVLGPRSGEWLTSRTGAWSGFHGELFRCVAPPPRVPPPSPSSHFLSSRPSAASSLINHGGSTSSPGRSGHHVPRITAGPAPSVAAASSSLPVSSVVLVEKFVDGALELDTSTASSTTKASASLSAAATASALGVSASKTPEELADRLCRLGTALPRYATTVTGHPLRPADVNFVCEVLQQQCLPLFLACKRRGIHQWGLRGWLKGIALTLLDNSGAELRVATPQKLVEMGWQHQRQLLASASASADGSTDVSDPTTAGALRMVMEGGLTEALAFLDYVLKRAERTARMLPVRKVAGRPVVLSSRDRDAAHVPISLIPFSSVEALLLRRAEESAVFTIFQSHPCAVHLAGCGVQRLALQADPHAHKSTKFLLLLVRTCGVVATWEMQECYEPPKYRRLRAPKRIVPSGSKWHRYDALTGGAAAAGGDVAALPPPPEIDNAAERLTWKHMKGMLHYYHRALRTTADDSVFLRATEDRIEGRYKGLEGANDAVAASAPSTSDAAVEATTPGVAGVKRERDDGEVVGTKGEGGESRHREDKARAAFDVTPQQGVPSMPSPPTSGASPQSTMSAVRQTVSSSLYARPPLSQLSTVSGASLNCTGLYPVDRAVALYVLRHHPQYFTQVVGCGIKDVYVGAPSSLSAAVAAVAATERRDASLVEGAQDVSNSSPHEVSAAPGSGARGSRGASPTSPFAGTTTATAAGSSRVMLVVERICGQRVEVDAEACYDITRDGCPLRPRMIIL